MTIESGIKDFAPTVGKTFNLAKSISLRQLHDYYYKYLLQILMQLS